jgi:iron complex outermembrane receptor protein
LNSNVNATVDGIDLSVDFRIAPRWSVNADLSWANGRFKNQLVPCDAPIPSGQLIAECQTSGNAGTAPDWNLTMRSDYSHRLTRDLDAFISGILTYAPRNPNSDPLYTVPSYALINLNVGVRNPAQGWELQAFVKNLTNNSAILAKSTLDLSSTNGLGGIFGPSGYSNITYQNPREFGVTFRYAFGSK